MNSRNLFRTIFIPILFLIFSLSCNSTENSDYESAIFKDKRSSICFTHDRYDFDITDPYNQDELINKSFVLDKKYNFKEEAIYLLKNLGINHKNGKCVEIKFYCESKLYEIPSVKYILPKNGSTRLLQYDPILISDYYINIGTYNLTIIFADGSLYIVNFNPFISDPLNKFNKVTEFKYRNYIFSSENVKNDNKSDINKDFNNESAIFRGEYSEFIPIEGIYQNLYEFGTFNKKNLNPIYSPKEESSPLLLCHPCQLGRYYLGVKNAEYILEKLGINPKNGECVEIEFENKSKNDSEPHKIQAIRFKLELSKIKPSVYYAPINGNSHYICMGNNLTIFFGENYLYVANLNVHNNNYSINYSLLTPLNELKEFKYHDYIYFTSETERNESSIFKTKYLINVIETNKAIIKSLNINLKNSDFVKIEFNDSKNKIVAKRFLLPKESTTVYCTKIFTHPYFTIIKTDDYTCNILFGGNYLYVPIYNHTPDITDEAKTTSEFKYRNLHFINSNLIKENFITKAEENDLANLATKVEDNESAIFKTKHLIDTVSYNGKFIKKLKIDPKSVEIVKIIFNKFNNLEPEKKVITMRFKLPKEEIIFHCKNITDHFSFITIEKDSNEVINNSNYICFSTIEKGYSENIMFKDDCMYILLYTNELDTNMRNSIREFKYRNLHFINPDYDDNHDLTQKNPEKNLNFESNVTQKNI